MKDRGDHSREYYERKNANLEYKKKQKLMSIPKQLQHNFVFDLQLTFESAEEKRCHRCANCGVWSESGNVDTFQGVCPKRDRRGVNRRKGQDRRGKDVQHVSKQETPADSLGDEDSRDGLPTLPSTRRDN